jgi:hypothetical protein
MLGAPQTVINPSVQARTRHRHSTATTPAGHPNGAMEARALARAEPAFCSAVVEEVQDETLRVLQPAF